MIDIKYPIFDIVCGILGVFFWIGLMNQIFNNWIGSTIVVVLMMGLTGCLIIARNYR